MLHDYFHSLFYNFRMSSSCIHITALLFRVEANFYRVFTKVESMKVNEENSANKLVIAYWEKLNHLQIYQLLNMAEIWDHCS